MSNYIKLEDVEKIISAYKYEHIRTITGVQAQIKALPSINLDDYRKRKIVCGDPFPPRNR